MRVRRAMRDFGVVLEERIWMSSGKFSGSICRASSNRRIFRRSFSFAGPEEDCNLRFKLEMPYSSLHLAHWKSSIYSVESTPSMQSERVV